MIAPSSIAVPKIPERAIPILVATPWWRRAALINAVIALILFGSAFASYISGDAGTNLHPDESRWLNRAHYIKDFFDPFGGTWNDQYLTRGQPPVGSYVMGLGLLLQGRDLNTNPAWDYRRSTSFNDANGMYPQHDDLMAGRRTNNVLGALAVVVVFFVAMRLSNRFGGISAAVLLIINPLQTWHNRLALADTTLTLTLSLLFLCVIGLLRRPRWGFALLVGVLIGLGGANKFTPMSLVAPLGLLGFVLLCIEWNTIRKLQDPSRMGWRALPPLGHLCWMLMSVPFVALATFVAAYPYLWTDPIGRIRILINFRESEMANQSVISPQFNVTGTLDAFHRTWINLHARWSGTRSFFTWIGLPDLGRWLESFDFLLGILGLVVLLYLGLRRGIRSPQFVVFVLIVTEILTVEFSLKTDFERYYLPIVLGLVIAGGSALGVAAGVVARLAMGYRDAGPTFSWPLPGRGRQPADQSG